MTERVLFGLVANRALAPSSKLAAADWITHDVHIDGLPETSDDACYRAMDWLHDVRDQLEAGVFRQVANLLNLEVDLLFFDYPANRPVCFRVGRVVGVVLRRLSARISSSCRRTFAATASRAWVRLSTRSASPVRVSSSPWRER